MILLDDFSKLDLQELQKARAAVLASAESAAEPIAIRKTVELIDRLIRRAEATTRLDRARQR